MRELAGVMEKFSKQVVVAHLYTFTKSNCLLRVDDFMIHKYLNKTVKKHINIL